MFFENEFEAFKFGLLPFETIYYERGRLHFLHEHFLRFKRAFWILNLPFEMRFDEFERKIYDYTFLQNKPFGAIRVMYLKDKLIIEEKEIKYTTDLYKKGFNLKIAKARKDSNNLLNYIKTFNMGLNLIEQMRANRKGFDSCLFLNQQGFVCEIAFANIFFRKGFALYTPHISCGLLPGIVRKKVISSAEVLGYKVKRGFLTLSDIAKMDECFITSSVAGVFPVRKIENIEFGSREFADTILKYEYFKRPWNI